LESSMRVLAWLRAKQQRYKPQHLLGNLSSLDDLYSDPTSVTSFLRLTSLSASGIESMSFTGFFNPFQAFSDSNEITIGIGITTNAPDAINIGMLISQPTKKRERFIPQTPKC
jgi:hypothetical protein